MTDALCSVDGCDSSKPPKPPRSAKPPKPDRPVTAPKPPKPAMPAKEVEECEAPGCTRVAKSKKACGMHYERMRTRGTYEQSPEYSYVVSGVGAWQHGPIIRDSTGFTFVWRCEEHPQEGEIDSDSARSLRRAREHWTAFHAGLFPDGEAIPEETTGLEDVLSDEAA